MADKDLEVKLPKYEDTTTVNVSDSTDYVVTSFVGVESDDVGEGVNGYRYKLGVEESEIPSGYTYTDYLVDETNKTSVSHTAVPPSTLEVDLADIRTQLSKNIADTELQQLSINDFNSFVASNKAITTTKLKEAIYGSDSKNGDFGDLAEAINEAFASMLTPFLDDDDDYDEDSEEAKILRPTGDEIKNYVPQVTPVYDEEDGFLTFEVQKPSVNAVNGGDADNEYGMLDGNIIAYNSMNPDRITGFTTGEWLNKLEDDVIPPTKIFPVGVTEHGGITIQEAFPVDELIGNGVITTAQIKDGTIQEEDLNPELQTKLRELGDVLNTITRTADTYTVPDDRTCDFLKQTYPTTMYGGLLLNTAPQSYLNSKNSNVQTDYSSILGKGNSLKKKSSYDGETVLGQFNAPSTVYYPLSVGGGTGSQDFIKLTVSSNSIIFSVGNDNPTFKMGLKIHLYELGDDYDEQGDIDTAIITAVVTKSATGGYEIECSNLDTSSNSKADGNKYLGNAQSIIRDFNGSRITLQPASTGSNIFDRIQKVEVNYIDISSFDSGTWSFHPNESAVKLGSDSTILNTIWCDRSFIWSIFKATTHKNILTLDGKGNLTITGGLTIGTDDGKKDSNNNDIVINQFKYGNTVLVSNNKSFTFKPSYDIPVAGMIYGYKSKSDVGPYTYLMFQVPIATRLGFDPSTKGSSVIKRLKITLRTGNNHCVWGVKGKSGTFNHKDTELKMWKYDIVQDPKNAVNNTKWKHTGTNGKLDENWVLYDHNTGCVRITIPFFKLYDEKGNQLKNCAVNVTVKDIHLEWTAG